MRQKGLVLIIILTLFLSGVSLIGAQEINEPVEVLKNFYIYLLMGEEESIKETFTEGYKENFEEDFDALLMATSELSKELEDFAKEDRQTMFMLLSLVVHLMEWHSEEIDKDKYLVSSFIEGKENLKVIAVKENDEYKIDEIIVDNISKKDNNTTTTAAFVERYSGSGIQNTRPFTVSGPWEIQWDAKGDIFQIYLYGEHGNLVDIAANQMDPGKGSYYSPSEGTYYLKVNAMGKWEITIIHVH